VHPRQLPISARFYMPANHGYRASSKATAGLYWLAVTVQAKNRIITLVKETMDNQPSDTGKAGAGRGKLSLIFAVLAFIACNGTILLIGVLSAIGISVSINPHLQAAAISLFAIVTLALVFRDFKRHRVVGPLLLAALAGITLIGTLYIHFNKLVESIGLLALFAAVLWGWQINRRHRGAKPPG